MNLGSKAVIIFQKHKKYILHVSKLVYCSFHSFMFTSLFERDRVTVLLLSWNSVPTCKFTFHQTANRPNRNHAIQTLPSVFIINHNWKPNTLQIYTVETGTPINIVQAKVRSLLEHSCAILISFKIVVIFIITSADFVLI